MTAALILQCSCLHMKIYQLMYPLIVVSANAVSNVTSIQVSIKWCAAYLKVSEPGGQYVPSSHLIGAILPCAQW
jgi:hypothetical protein